MKRNIVLAGLVACFTSVAHAQVCVDIKTFENRGWVVHDSATFENHAKLVKSKIKSGLDDGSVVFDTSGPIMTNQTLDGQTLLLDAMMFDNLATPRDEMYGDYAIVEIVNDSRDLVEVRWYDGKKNIVFNPNFLTCVTEQAPHADNSVF